MGELARALEQVVQQGRRSDFYADLGDAVDIRDRMAAHLDAALFESVLSAEVRSLAVCGEFGRLFDQLSQLASRVLRYRWLAVTTTNPVRLGLHAHPVRRLADEVQAREALAVPLDAPATIVEDEDAEAEHAEPSPIVEPIHFGDQCLGSLAIACHAGRDAQDATFARLLARELGGPLRIVGLVEDLQRLSTIDPLTGLRNRRSLVEIVKRELARVRRTRAPLTALLIDVDHFKAVNDRRGHASGDLTLTAVAQRLATSVREVDIVGRWGGEEFVVVLPDTPLAGAQVVAERLRAAIEALELTDGRGATFSVTASIGLTAHRDGEALETLIERSDRAMYAAKAAGRNRVEAIAQRRSRPTRYAVGSRP